METDLLEESQTSSDSLWESIPLGDVSVFINGDRGQNYPSQSDYVHEGIPFINATNLVDGRVDAANCAFITEKAFERLSGGKIHDGDLLFCLRGSLGKVARVKGLARGAIASSLVIIRATERCEREYLYYVLIGPLGQQLSKELNNGSAQPNISARSLQQSRIPLPPLGVQRAIASILGTLDDKIELNRRMNETLEAMARALFKSWFVDFDPVRAKAEGRRPSGMDAETAKLFPSEFEESELGEIPKGWRRAPLRDWVTPLSGGTPSKGNAALWNGDIPWISPKVMTAIHADDADRYVTQAAIGNGTRTAPAGSTLVMVRGMGLHEEVRVSQARREVTFNQDVKALVPRSIEASLLFFALLDAQKQLLGRVESSGHGTGRLPSDILLSHPIAAPPLSLQKQLIPLYDSINSRIATARAESRSVAAIRDAILPRLVSGELFVRDAERIAEASV